MNSKDDAVAEPLIGILRKQGFIDAEDGAFLEWQGAWEFGLAAFCHGEDQWLNVNPDGSVTVY